MLFQYMLTIKSLNRAFVKQAQTAPTGANRFQQQVSWGVKGMPQCEGVKRMMSSSGHRGCWLAADVGWLQIIPHPVAFATFVRPPSIAQFGAATRAD